MEASGPFRRLVSGDGAGAAPRAQGPRRYGAAGTPPGAAVCRGRPLRPWTRIRSAADGALDAATVCPGQGAGRLHPRALGDAAVVGGDDRGTRGRASDSTTQYQFWTFGYSTGDPIPYSACLLRRSLEDARRRFDPAKTDPSFDRMVLVGHSMGGLLAKMMVVESGTRLWSEVSDRPFDELVGEPDDRNVFGQALLVKPLPEVRRVVFIATPHRGSKLSRGWLQSLGARLVGGTEPLRSAYGRLVARNNPGSSRKVSAKAFRLPSRNWSGRRRFSEASATCRPAPGLKFHSIIAVRPDHCRPTEPTAWSAMRVRTWRRRPPRSSSPRATCARITPTPSGRFAGCWSNT